MIFFIFFFHHNVPPKATSVGVSCTKNHTKSPRGQEGGALLAVGFLSTYTTCAVYGGAALLGIYRMLGVFLAWASVARVR